MKTEKTDCLKENERIDNTGFGEVKVIQLESMGYGVDAILLAAFAAGETGAKPLRRTSQVVDLGSGSGIIGMVLAHKIPDITVLGIDKREDAINRARRASLLSKLSDRVEFIHAEINGFVISSDNEALSSRTRGLGGKFDAVVSNPPYFKQSAAIPSQTNGKFIARHETTATLDDFIATADRLLDKGGDLYMVHRPDRLADIICGLRTSGLEPKELQFVVPRTGEAANIVLIHAVKGAGAELKLLPEIAVHNQDNEYTAIINKIYER